MTKILTPKIFIVFVVSFQVELTGEWDYNDETFHCSAAQPETSCLPATFGFSDDCEDLMAELFAPWEPVSPVASTSGFQLVAESPKSPGQKRKEKKGKKRMFILPKHKTRLIENLTSIEHIYRCYLDRRNGLNELEEIFIKHRNFIKSCYNL